MKKVYDFLKEASTYYIATVDGDQPRVRPFGTVNIFEDKLYVRQAREKRSTIRSSPTARLNFVL